MRKKVCIITPSMMSVRFFLKPLIAALRAHYDITLVTNVDDPEYLNRIGLQIRVVNIRIERKISLVRDAKSLIQLTQFLVREGFDVVHSVAPKAGLLGMLAAFIARVPNRLHVFQGEVWVTKKGLMRAILKNADRLVALLATHLQVVSASERDFLLNEKIITAEKSVVLASGSICGVDMERFSDDGQFRQKVRQTLGLDSKSLVLLYLGRLNRDKGIPELLTVFSKLVSVDGMAPHLLLVGPDEENMLNLVSSYSENIKSRLHIVPYTEEPQQYMAAADLFVFPSHREGFGLVIMEAASMKIASVATRVYGVTDAVLEEQTGLLFELGNNDDFLEKLQALVNDKERRLQMGERAYQRCLNEFSQSRVVKATLDYYLQNF